MCNKLFRSFTCKNDFATNSIKFHHRNYIIVLRFALFTIHVRIILWTRELFCAKFRDIHIILAAQFFVPPVNEVWGKVMFLHLCSRGREVCLGRICLQGWRVCIGGGGLPTVGSAQPHPTELEKRVVRILIECFLILGGGGISQKVTKRCKTYYFSKLAENFVYLCWNRRDCSNIFCIYDQIFTNLELQFITCTFIWYRVTYSNALYLEWPTGITTSRRCLKVHS